MGPPAEQLIRDYLNRLSVAARGQLVPDDRRALVDRTREFIERKAGFRGPPTAVEVARLLSGLGDPAELVSQERHRLAVLSGEDLEPVSRGRLARVLFGQPGKLRGASWHWPAQPGGRADLKLTLFESGAQASRPGATARTPVSQEAWPAAGQPALSPGSPGDHGSVRPQWPTLTAASAESDLPRDILPGAGQPDSWPPATGEQQDADQLTAWPAAETAGLPDASAAVATGQPAVPVMSRAERARQILVTVAAWSCRNKLEAVAIVLLGLGGVIFPPVWLLGAAATLASRLWDYRDKWTALAVPVLLTVIGTAVGVAVGGRGSFGHGMHDGWVFAVGTSRVVTVLSAWYLGWRAARGRRPTAVPPWDKPHRVA